MPTTTNFGWTTPADTDLVKDGAAAIRTLGNGIDTSLIDLKGGTTGQVLSKASNTDLDFSWVAQDDSNAIQNAIVDAKGDLISATAADTPARLAVGTNGQVLIADSTTATGLKWGSVSSAFVGCSLLNSGSYTISNATNTNLTFDTELYDTDGFHSTSANTDRITIPSGKDGKYLITAAVAFDSNATGERSMRLMKNGSTADDNNRVWAGFGSSAGNTTMTIARIVDAVAGDYFTLRVYQSSGGNRTIVAGSGYEGWTHFDATYLGA